ncbi:MAG: SPOR domain-containing protein [Casimicrobiaceae bacterium]
MNMISAEKLSNRATQARRQRGNTVLGMLIGFLLGLTVAAIIAFVLTRIPNPFDGKSGKSDITGPHLSSVERDSAKSADRPRFDFSKILPGTEDRRSPKAEAATASAPDKPVSVVPASDQNIDRSPAGKYFLQAGAYQNAADAEDQRAKLALMGIEASMQSVEVPERGTLNRIRLGPYSSVDEMNQAKAELLKRGVSTAVIKSQ